MKEIIITEQTAGGRLDKMLFKYLDQAPSGFVFKMLRKKNIVLNDKKAEGKEILKNGDSVKIYLSDETFQKFHSAEKTKSNRSISKVSLDTKKYILFEDENIIAFNKPSGMLSQKVKSSDFSINDILLSYLGHSELFTPGISNRLDRNTSGIVIAGKNPNAVRLLNNAVKERRIRKLYLCIVSGKVSEITEIEGYLSKDETKNIVRVSKTKSDDSSYIKTVYRPLSFNGSNSLLEVDLITGKSHQIRAHLASVGHPIIGDEKYGLKKVNNLFKQKYNVSSQLLHAYKLTFEEMEKELSYLNGKSIICHVPADFRNVVKGENLCLPGDQEA